MHGFSNGRGRSSVLGVRPSALIRYRVPGTRNLVPGTRAPFPHLINKALYFPSPFLDTLAKTLPSVLIGIILFKGLHFSNRKNRRFLFVYLIYLLSDWLDTELVACLDNPLYCRIAVCVKF
jgi:hypothetical protein